MKRAKFLLLLIASTSIVILSFRAINSPGGYKIGDAASDFNLKNIDEKTISLSDYKNAKGFIIIFTCNTCPYSIAYEDRIIALDKKYKEVGYPVIAINPNNPANKKGDSFELMQKRAQDKKFTFPYLVDAGQKVYPKYGARRTPHVFLLNKENNKLIVEYIGAIDNNSHDANKVSVAYVANAVDALLRGDKPVIKTTKAIGCTIK